MAPVCSSGLSFDHVWSNEEPGGRRRFTGVSAGLALLAYACPGAHARPPPDLTMIARPGLFNALLVNY